MKKKEMDYWKQVRKNLHRELYGKPMTEEDIEKWKKEKEVTKEMQFDMIRERRRK